LSTASLIIISLASHWQCVTDSEVCPLTGSKSSHDRSVACLTHQVYAIFTVTSLLIYVCAIAYHSKSKAFTPLRLVASFCDIYSSDARVTHLKCKYVQVWKKHQRLQPNVN